MCTLSPAVTASAPSVVAGSALAPAATRWPDIERVPAGPRTAIAAACADILFRRAVRTLPLRVEYPDGTVRGGGAHTAVLVLHRPRDFAARLGVGGLIGFGESYMAGDWSSPDPTAVLTVFATHIDHLVPPALHRLRRAYVRKHPADERNSESNTRANIARHYDLSNELFALFLDETLTYSGALFSAVDPAPRWPELAPAQRNKIDRILDRAAVGPGTALLEIGTGWGELAIRAAERGAVVRSVTLSSEQRAHALARVGAAGLSDRVRIDLLDYRSVTGEYDAVVSVEMIEAVGYDYLDDYLRVIDRLLTADGCAVIQAITMPHHRMLATRDTYTWVHKYIFPGGFLPSTELLREALARSTGLVVREDFSMGEHYAHTLRLWQERFLARREAVLALGFDPVFCRMWRLYLAHAEAGFRSRYLDVRQLLLTRGEISEADHRPSR